MEKNIEKKKYIKFLHDKRSFKIGDWVLKWNVKDRDKGKNDKFDSLWLGPFVISDMAGENSYFLQETYGSSYEFLVHAQFLKPFFS